MRTIQSEERRIGTQTISILLVATLLLSLAPAPAAAQSPSDVNYTSEYLVTGEFGDVVFGPNGDIYTSSETRDQVRKYDRETGSLEWSRNVNDDIPHKAGGPTNQSAIATTDHGVVFFQFNSGTGSDYVTMLDFDTGNKIDDATIGLSANPPDIGTVSGEDKYIMIATGDGSPAKKLVTDSTSIKFVNEGGALGAERRYVADSYNNTYFACCGLVEDNTEISKLDSTYGTPWPAGAIFVENGAFELALDESGVNGENTSVYAAQYHGNVSKVTQTEGSPDSVAWTTDITSGAGTAEVIAYDSTRDLVVSGDDNGDTYILDDSGGILQTITDPSGSSTSDDIIGIDADTSNSKAAVVTANQKGTVRLYTENLQDVESINLNIDDTTLIPGQSTNYDVTGVYPDSSTTDVTGSSNVSSDDTNVVSVDEPNTEIDYQGDGTTVVRSNYTNDTGTLLWDNESVETDTPVIDLTLEENPATLDKSYNYTVSKTLFGSTTDVTAEANVSSDNVSIVSVSELGTNYTAEGIGFANLTANNSVNGVVYNDTVELEVIPPEALTWDNWDYLNSGEKMVVILSDWTVLWLFISVLLSSVLAFRFNSGGVGLTSLGGLTLVGWVLGFLPDYITLSLMIFYIFIGFLFEWQINVSS